MLSSLAGIGIHIGDSVWTLDSSLFVYLVIAAIVGIIAEFLVGWRLPFGIIGAVIVGFIGIWLMTQVIIITGLPDWSIDNVPLVPALIGAVVLVALWHAITFRSWSHRRRYYRPAAE
jgi:uncharacterized membrane protein YeaQ/YmgE (transglycosylase-associated protein family)